MHYFYEYLLQVREKNIKVNLTANYCYSVILYFCLLSISAEFFFNTLFIKQIYIYHVTSNMRPHSHSLILPNHS